MDRGHPPVLSGAHSPCGALGPRVYYMCCSLTRAVTQELAGDQLRARPHKIANTNPQTLRPMCHGCDRCFTSCAGLNKKYTARAEYDKAITETENAFGKILESSKTLLHVLRKESQTLKAKVGE